jgi:hypothetical protein
MLLDPVGGLTIKKLGNQRDGIALRCASRPAKERGYLAKIDSCPR